MDAAQTLQRTLKIAACLLPPPPHLNQPHHHHHLHYPFQGHEATCQSIFDALPLDQCNPTSLFGLGIESVQIVPSANLTICQQQRPPGSTTATPPDGPVPPRYAYMAAGIAVGLVVVSVGVVVWRKTVLQRRERYTYQPLN